MATWERPTAGLLAQQHHVEYMPERALLREKDLRRPLRNEGDYSHGGHDKLDRPITALEPEQIRSHSADDPDPTPRRQCPDGFTEGVQPGRMRQAAERKKCVGFQFGALPDPVDGCLAE
jgi:hypothetical protein